MLRDRIYVITDLLMGAVWADEKLLAEEEVAVRELLGELLEVGDAGLPDNIDRHIADFVPDRFSMEIAAREFDADPAASKRKLLELVAVVIHADGVLDASEDAYLRALGSALGLAPEDYRDLVLDHDVSELRAALERLRAAPPPMVTPVGRSSRPPPPPMVDREAVAAPPPPRLPSDLDADD